MKRIPENLSTSNPREIALVVLQRFRDRDSDASSLLHDLLRRGGVHGPDARLATDLAMGILRRRSRLDAVLKTMTHRPWKDTPPLVRDVLRLGAYQLLFMDRIPPHAAVNESVALARRWAGQGHAALANAILRCLAQEGSRRQEARKEREEGREERGEGRLEYEVPVAEWPVFYSHPKWLVNYLLAHDPRERVEALLEWNNRVPALMLRANRSRITAEDLAAKLSASGIAIARVGWPTPESLTLEGPVGNIASAEWYLQGLATVQDGAAQLIAHLVAPRPGERIVDWCAAPGGKTTHLAELSDDRADILALDVDAGRLAQVAIQAERLGLRSIRTALVSDEVVQRIAAAPVDAILVDAPCSGLGTLQRHPDIHWRRRMKDIEHAAQGQVEILTAAARCVAAGGRLIYSTCTLGAIENEQVIERFLAGHTQFVRADRPDQSDRSDRSDLSDLSHTSHCCRPFLNDLGDLHTWPPEHHLDGFFAARLTRNK